ncbi:hypothetical protein KFL_012940010, partial [Klebsormidium nitens]
KATRRRKRQQRVVSSDEEGGRGTDSSFGVEFCHVLDVMMPTIMPEWAWTFGLLKAQRRFMEGQSWMGDVELGQRIKNNGLVVLLERLFSGKHRTEWASAGMWLPGFGNVRAADFNRDLRLEGFLRWFPYWRPAYVKYRIYVSADFLGAFVNERSSSALDVQQLHRFMLQSDIGAADRARNRGTLWDWGLLYEELDEMRAVIPFQLGVFAKAAGALGMLRGSPLFIPGTVVDALSMPGPEHLRPGPLLRLLKREGLAWVGLTEEMREINASTLNALAKLTKESCEMEREEPNENPKPWPADGIDEAEVVRRQQMAVRVREARDPAERDGRKSGEEPIAKLQDGLVKSAEARRCRSVYDFGTAGFRSKIPDNVEAHSLLTDVINDVQSTWENKEEIGKYATNFGGGCAGVQREADVEDSRQRLKERRTICVNSQTGEISGVSTTVTGPVSVAATIRDFESGLHPELKPRDGDTFTFIRTPADSFWEPPCRKDMVDAVVRNLATIEELAAKASSRMMLDRAQPLEK